MSNPNLDNETGCAWHESFALQILGDSMEPEFPDKCVVIIEQAERCSHGMYVFVEVEGVRWFRQYRVVEQDKEWLIALNRLYPEIDLTGCAWKARAAHGRSWGSLSSAISDVGSNITGMRSNLGAVNLIVVPTA